MHLLIEKSLHQFLKVYHDQEYYHLLSKDDGKIIMSYGEQENSGISLLYVDDEPVLLNMSKLFLEKTGGFSVTTAGNAKDALKLLSEKPFDAVVSDYQMSGILDDME